VINNCFRFSVIQQGGGETRRNRTPSPSSSHNSAAATEPINWYSEDISDDDSDNIATAANVDDDAKGEHQPSQRQQQQGGQLEQRDEVGDNFNYIELRAENSRRLKNFKILGREATFKIRQPPEGRDISRWLENAFREIHAYALRSSEPGNYVGLTFNSTNLTHGPAGLSLRPVQDLTHGDIWNLVSSVAQSAGGLNIAETFDVQVFNVVLPVGRGGVTNKLTHAGVAKRSILQLGNTDNMCLPRSLVVARVYSERGNLRSGELHKRWNSIRCRTSALQRELAYELTRRTGIVVPAEGCGIREIDRFQQVLLAGNIVIVVYNFSTFGLGEKPLYDGASLHSSLTREPAHRLNIMYYEDSRHFNPILNLAAAAGCRGGFCALCNKGYRNERGHRCAKRCPRCYATPSCETRDAAIVPCDVCNRTFFGPTCFERHRMEKSYDEKSCKSVCKSVRNCDGCGRFVKTASPHKCDEVYCRVCRTKQPVNHRCFMHPPKARTISDKRGQASTSSALAPSEENDVSNSHARNRIGFIFYDFETRQDESLEGCENIKIHVPTLCVAQQICEACAAIDDMTVRCRWCGTREFIFQHDPVKQLVDFATRETKYFKKFICIAHNAKAFDAQFILKHLVETEDTRQKPDLILNGSKIIVMTVGRTKFVDSVNYMPMALAELPKAFGLQGDSVKGTFPHLFNTIENQNYVGPLPALHYYSPDQMKDEDRKRFLAWHAEMLEKNTVFDFNKEIIKYCRNDVDILRRACMAFRRIFLERGNVCPFEECTTIASTCMRVFHKNFLRENQIGIIPAAGYRNHDSRTALQWLVLRERELGQRIIHGGREREYRIEGVPVDGYYESQVGNTTKRHVLQFHGCFWHGCPMCYRENRDRKLVNIDNEHTLEARYNLTLARTNRLRKLGYYVEEKWECVFNNEIRENPKMQEFLKNHPMLKHPPLEPRDAFFGGRTGNIATLCEIKDSEKIRYVDVCSLYPFILKTGTFPIGHPDIYIGEECAALIGTPGQYNFDAVEGLVRCRVLPPRDLFHPVLPYRAHGKLMFSLCRSCCETFAKTECTHERSVDREFEGTWVSCELRKAIEKGYLVSSVSEIWQYNATRYNPATRQGGLFTEYINCFLQLKQEASGWPSECVDDESKERYLREYENTEGITLEKNNIARNPGLRSVAKLCLNSFWGKFGQRSNLPKTEVINDYQQLASLLSSPEHEVTSLLPVNDEVLYVSWQLRQEAIAASPMTNVVIAAYTTAQARLKLYEYLERLDQRVLYYDTDSCIYLSTGAPNEYEPSTGNFLGDMTDELESYGRGSYIESFVSGGPKFYAYVVRTPDERTHEVCKIKGITLNYSNYLAVNFNSIKSLILQRENEQSEEKESSAINLRFSAIRRTAFHEVVTRVETKVCAPVLLKRRFINKHFSLPYGYVSK